MDVTSHCIDSDITESEANEKQIQSECISRQPRANGTLPHHNTGETESLTYCVIIWFYDITWWHHRISLSDWWHHELLKSADQNKVKQSLTSQPVPTSGPTSDLDLSDAAGRLPVTGSLSGTQIVFFTLSFDLQVRLPPRLRLTGRLSPKRQDGLMCFRPPEQSKRK